MGGKGSGSRAEGEVPYNKQQMTRDQNRKKHERQQEKIAKRQAAGQPQGQPQQAQPDYKNTNLKEVANDLGIAAEELRDAQRERDEGQYIKEQPYPEQDEELVGSEEPDYSNWNWPGDEEEEYRPPRRPAPTYRDDYERDRRRPEVDDRRPARPQVQQDEFGREIDPNAVASKGNGGIGGRLSRLGGDNFMPAGGIQLFLVIVAIAIVVTLAALITPLRNSLGVVSKNEVAAITDGRIVNALDTHELTTLAGEVITLQSSSATKGELGDYAKLADLNSYVSSGSLTGSLNSYVTKNLLTTELAKYGTVGTLNSGLDSISELSDEVSDELDAMNAEVTAGLALAAQQRAAALLAMETQANQTADDLEAAVDLKIDELEAVVAENVAGVEYTLEESSGDYTLTILSHEDDAVYGAEVVLIWRNGDRTALGDTTPNAAIDNFFARIDGDAYDYVPTVVWLPADDTTMWWWLAEVSFMLDEIELDADEEFEEEMELEDEMGDFDDDFEAYVVVRKGAD